MSLHDPMTDGAIALDPLAERHRAGLRAACDADPDIWAIYPTRWDGPHFDANFDALLANRQRLPFATMRDGAVVGMTSYINPDPARGVVEIGNTFVAPSARGGPLNRAVKALMIGRAIAEGFRRIEFRIDNRNVRSQAAVLKLGAAREGVMRHERVTWNGHLRDTVLFALLKEEWKP